LAFEKAKLSYFKSAQIVASLRQFLDKRARLGSNAGERPAWADYFCRDARHVGAGHKVGCA